MERYPSSSMPFLCSTPDPVVVQTSCARWKKGPSLLYSSSSPLTHGTDDGRNPSHTSGIHGIHSGRTHSPKMSVSFLLAARLISAKAFRLIARLPPLLTPRNPPAMLGNPHGPPLFKPSQPDRTLDEAKSLKKPLPDWSSGLKRVKLPPLIFS